MFDVEMSDTGRPLKMPMNRGDDPYDVAERFLLENGVPSDNRQAIVNFIYENAGSAGAHRPCSRVSKCPFSFAASRMTPQQQSAGTFTVFSAGLSAVVFAKQLLYRLVSLEMRAATVFVCYPADHCTPVRSSPLTVLPRGCAVAAPRGNVDSLTGAGAYIPTGDAPPQAQPAAAAPAQGFVYSPHRDYQLFEALPTMDKVGGKLRELAAGVPADVQPSAEQLAAGGPLDDLLHVRASFNTRTA